MGARSRETVDRSSVLRWSSFAIDRYALYLLFASYLSRACREVFTVRLALGISFLQLLEHSMLCKICGLLMFNCLAREREADDFMRTSGGIGKAPKIIPKLTSKLLPIPSPQLHLITFPRPYKSPALYSIPN